MFLAPFAPRLVPRAFCPVPCAEFSMLEGLQMFLDALVGFLHPKIIFDVFWSTQLGIIVGMLPGLTATMGVALMTTLTFKMAAENAVIILICMYIGAIYGGSRSAILLNIPGTPAYPLLLLTGILSGASGQSRPGDWHCHHRVISRIDYRNDHVAFFTPLIGNFALKFQSYEFLALDFWHRHLRQPDRAERPFKRVDCRIFRFIRRHGWDGGHSCPCAFALAA